MAGGPDSSPSDILSSGAARGTALEAFGPAHRCARVRISHAFWNRSGFDPFLNLDVPYTGTSSGRLSEDALEVALAAADKADTASGLRILEIGAGTGVFAKLFLDRMKEIAPERYGSARYLVTDGSARMLEAQRAFGVLDDHRDVVSWRQLDAAGDWDDLEPFDVILGTYILDSTPFDLLALRDDRIWRKEVRCVLDHPDPDEIAAIRSALDADDPDRLAGLARRAQLFGIQTRHVEIARDDIPHAGTIPSDTGGETLPFVHSRGALDCIERCMSLLNPGGVAVFSDYGHVEPMQSHETTEFQAFGLSTAAGLNFPQIDAAFSARADLGYFAPVLDQGNLITRVLTRDPTMDLGALVEDLYGAVRHAAMTLPVETAREFLRGRMFETARELYAKALDLQPRNWALLEEVATMFQGSIEEHGIALELADLGLRLNPLSPGLWRVRAASFLALGDQGAADAAITRAAELAPANPAMLECKAEVALAGSRYREALLAIGEALAHDLEGEHHESLLALQQSVLARIATDQHVLLMAESNRFRALDTPP